MHNAYLHIIILTDMGVLKLQTVFQDVVGPEITTGF